MKIFNNTEIAFKSRTDRELKKAWLLFKLMSYPSAVKISGIFATIGIRFKVPVRWLVKPTIFSHFCGGETLDECKTVVEHLARFKVHSILDYAAEDQDSEEEIKSVMDEIIRTMDFATSQSYVPCSVFKPTALAPGNILGNAGSFSSGNDITQGIEKFRDNIRTLCQAACERDLPVMIDAEESHYQEVVDSVATEMMQLYNSKKAIVFNTLQMYRHDRLEFLSECIRKAGKNNYHLGIKLVRGAYMDQERERARRMGYPSPIYPDKQSTDSAFNSAISLCLDNLNNTSIFIGTHNEDSLIFLMEKMKSLKLKNDDPRVLVSQLYGMSDHISFNMAKHSYNVAKYLPYGPVRYLLPYLIRRAEENKSVSGQAGRELHYLKLEINRRNRSEKDKLNTKP
ncbi:MAG: proline dehydrogenase family protein [Bacteroidales bacterium]